MKRFPRICITKTSKCKTKREKLPRQAWRTCGEIEYSWARSLSKPAMTIGVICCFFFQRGIWIAATLATSPTHSRNFVVNHVVWDWLKDRWVCTHTACFTACLPVWQARLYLTATQVFYSHIRGEKNFAQKTCQYDWTSPLLFKKLHELFKGGVWLCRFCGTTSRLTPHF